MYAPAIGSKFFWLLLKDAQIKVFQGVKSQNWKASLWCTKKVKNKRLKSPLGWKICKIIFFSKSACLQQGKWFFLVTAKRYPSRNSLCKLESNLKNKSQNYKKVEGLRFEVLFFVQKLKKKSEKICSSHRRQFSFWVIFDDAQW